MTAHHDAVAWLREMFPAPEPWPEFYGIRVATYDRRPDDERMAEALAWQAEHAKEVGRTVAELGALPMPGPWAERPDGFRPGLRGLEVPVFFDRLAAMLIDRSAEVDMFVCPYLHRGSGRRKGQAWERRHIHVDIDGAVDLARVKALGGMAVFSGSATKGRPHAHVYVRLARPVDPVMHEVLCRALGSLVGGDAHDESKVSDEDVLRLPGTVNHKNGAAVTWGIRPDDTGVRTWEPATLQRILGVPDGPEGEAIVAGVRERQARIQEAYVDEGGGVNGSAFSRALAALGPRVEWVRGGRARAHCPSPTHTRGNVNAALSLTATAGGRVWPNCFAGCDQHELRELLGLSPDDLWGDLLATQDVEIEWEVPDPEEDPTFDDEEEDDSDRWIDRESGEVNLGYLLDPDWVRKIVLPDLLMRSDGVMGCFYTGQVNYPYGKQSSGKSWLALGSAVEVLNSGGTVGWVDMDEFGDEKVTGRLLDLGQPREVVGGGVKFRFFNARDARTYLKMIERAAGAFDLVVVDGMAAFFQSLGGGENPGYHSGPIIEAWDAGIVPLRRRRKKTLILIDHSAKGSKTGNDGPEGGEAKTRYVRGSEIYVEAPEPHLAPLPGFLGYVGLYVHKDNDGHMKADALARPGTWSKGQLVEFGRLYIDSSPTRPGDPNDPDRPIDLQVHARGDYPPVPPRPASAQQNPPTTPLGQSVVGVTSSSPPVAPPPPTTGDNIAALLDETPGMGSAEIGEALDISRQGAEKWLNREARFTATSCRGMTP